MTVWFTSDHHFGHANVITYSQRPFASVEEMTEVMIDSWNKCVQRGDLVYHLGDFAFCSTDEAIEIVKRLQGNKYLILGNHDKKTRKDVRFQGYWIWTKDLVDVVVEGQRIVLCHYPLLTWNQAHRGAWDLHGHSHGSLKADPHSRRIDVGVDCHNYAPVSFETLKGLMATKTFTPVDHHGET